MHRPTTLSPETSVLLNICLQSACLMLSSKLGWLYSAAKPPRIALLTNMDNCKAKNRALALSHTQKRCFPEQIGIFSSTPSPTAFLMWQWTYCSKGPWNWDDLLWRNPAQSLNAYTLAQECLVGLSQSALSLKCLATDKEASRNPHTPSGNACHGKAKNLQPLKKQQQKRRNTTRFVHFSALLQPQSDERRQTSGSDG